MHDYPFFTDAHRERFARFDAFVRDRIAPLAGRDESDTLGVARAYVRLLADGGWLDWIDPIDIRTACLLRARIGYASALADTMLAMQGLGGIPIAVWGSDAQRGRWIDAIKRGAIAAFALTEPGAGSDPAGMTLAATRDGEGWRLTGEKTFISNAGIADVMVVFARTADGHDDAHTAFIVPGDAAGMSSMPMALIAPHPIGTVRFDGVRVSDADRLGDMGAGLRVALGTLDRFRCSVGAAACGMARRALDEAKAHVAQREQFGRPLAKFQAVQSKLAEMAVDTDAADLLVARAAWMIDTSPSLQSAGYQPDAAAKRASSAAKLFATDRGHEVVDKAVQLFGGVGLVHGHIAERLYREIRALRIYEGTSEIQKLVIARTLFGE
jgi:alkylation response protein AidB-like acyl-CoA dehydrogenase